MNNPGIWPCLRFTDAEAARRFLTEVFGFTETLTVRGDDGVSIVHGELRWPEGGGVMYSSAAECENGPAPGEQYLCVVTGDPDAVHERAVAAGAQVPQPPGDSGHGSRLAAVADPEGNIWTFDTYRGA
ncbi:VOC family protein [Amycolatopsis cihanbeyliensis]|uniref:Putative glyoxalase superfamily protein PhnB n=1 Tax=Amycolatopsis cihanbeyliensis TaxID=1128664 RepID=A0A542DGT7_AMYCI|nr:VOC family protein [Amycolatopsis cihanbeyliensis]TQJ02260.1 putative glyoxalase superfamily protein PhnB [Amycolatopsis cihanbeyliensis]